MGRQSRKKRERKREGARPTSVVLPPPENTAAVFFDSERQQIVFGTKDMLLNQLRRDSPKIAESFDKLCEPNLASLSEELGRTSTLCFLAFRRAQASGDEPRRVVALLLINALNSVCAAVEVLRAGYRLQPSMILRNTVETVCVVLHLAQRPEDLR